MLLLGGAMTAPRALRAQQKAMPVIGYLGVASPGPFAPFVAAFLASAVRVATSLASASSPAS
jgi:hypothetical protein